MKEEFELSECKKKILKNLFIYRAASAIQLSKLVYQTQCPTNSNQKFMYGELSKLNKLGLVKVYKPQKDAYKYSLYFLTPKGHEYVQNSLDVIEGQQDGGWYPGNSFGWFEYDVYSPPLEQIVHHTMLIDLFINISVDVDNEFQHRNNLYAKRKTWSNHILRMDAEVRYGNKSIAIEVDRGTESHQQLISKFQNYLYYFTDLESNNQELDFKDIVFVVDNVKQRDGGLKRRWLNIMSAFYKTMGEYAFKVDLHFCTLDNAYKLLSHELFHDRSWNILFQTLNSKYDLNLYKVWRDTVSKKIFLAQNGNGEYYFTMNIQEYSTTIIRLYNLMKTKKIDCKDYLLACVHGLPNFKYDLARYDVPLKVQQLFKELQVLITIDNRVELQRVKEVIDGHLIKLE